MTNLSNLNVQPFWDWVNSLDPNAARQHGPRHGHGRGGHGYGHGHGGHGYGHGHGRRRGHGRFGYMQPYTDDDAEMIPDPDEDDIESVVEGRRHRDGPDATDDEIIIDLSDNEKTAAGPSDKTPEGPADTRPPRRRPNWDEDYVGGGPENRHERREWRERHRRQRDEENLQRDQERRERREREREERHERHERGGHRGGHRGHRGPPPFVHGFPPFGGRPGPVDLPALASWIQNTFIDPALGNANPEARTAQAQAQEFTPAIDIFNTPEAYVVDVALPGLDKDHMELKWDAESSSLVVSGVVHRAGDEALLAALDVAERRIGAFERRVVLGTAAAPARVVDDEISAKLEAGVLRVRVPKATGAGAGEAKRIVVE